jgi:aryl-alcohol dehydrogenase-like predicted oxidoreductase
LKLALGTVQFGLRYGVANVTGQVPLPEVKTILAVARTAGMSVLDTAAAYGESESRLGEAGVGGWKIVTKLPPLPGDCDDLETWIAASVETSLRKLGVAKLYGLLLHRSADLAGSSGAPIYNALRRLQAAGAVEKIGVSIYDPSELSALTPARDLQLVQAPYNVLDRRIDQSGWLDRLKQRGVEVHARSAFLQGLLLMDEASRPQQFARWSGLWKTWHDWLAEHRLEPLDGALGFALANPAIDRVVVGVELASQLTAIISASRHQAPPAPESLATEDESLVNPSKWNVQ